MWQGEGDYQKVIEQEIEEALLLAANYSGTVLLNLTYECVAFRIAPASFHKRLGRRAQTTRRTR